MKKRLCSIHGVWLKDEHTTRCPKCKKNTAKRYDSIFRDKDADSFYHSRAWKRVRGLQLSKYPLCVECGRPAKIVDHIVEIKDGGCKLCLDNLQSMCIGCHNKKTSKQKIYREGVVKSLQTDEISTGALHKISQKPFSGGTLG